MSLMVWHSDNNEVIRPLSMNPRKFMLWAFIVSIIMLFAALTSVFLIKRAEDFYKELYIPDLFWVSSGIILVSSVTMHWAYLSAKKDNFFGLRTGLLITMGLGIAFLVTQFYAWKDLVDHNIYVSFGPAIDTLYYVFSGMHGLHLISGLIILFYTYNKAAHAKIHAKKTNVIENCMVYWHFLDVLWLYLFVFLLFNK